MKLYFGKDGALRRRTDRRPSLRRDNEGEIFINRSVLPLRGNGCLCLRGCYNYNPSADESLRGNGGLSMQGFYNYNT